MLLAVKISCSNLIETKYTFASWIDNRLHSVAQLISKSQESKVTPSAVQEIGWFKIQLTQEGQQDPLFQGLKNEFDVFQWHQDTFEIPREGKHLAQSKNCFHQALKVGENAYGLQFHIEVNEEFIEDWIRGHFRDPKVLKSKRNEMLGYYSKIKDEFNEQAAAIYRNFLKIMLAKKVTV